MSEFTLLLAAGLAAAVLIPFEHARRQRRRRDRALKRLMVLLG